MPYAKLQAVAARQVRYLARDTGMALLVTLTHLAGVAALMH